MNSKPLPSNEEHKIDRTLIYCISSAESKMENSIVCTNFLHLRIFFNTSLTEKGVPRFLTKTAKRKRPPNLSKSTFQNPNEGTLTPWTSYRVISTNRLKYLRPFGFKRLFLFSILFPKKASWAIFAKCLFPHMGKINHLKKLTVFFWQFRKLFFSKSVINQQNRRSSSSGGLFFEFLTIWVPI